MVDFSTQLVSSFWEWVKQDINNWLRALTNPVGFLASLDLDKDESFNTTIRVSAFSILLALLCDIPGELAYMPSRLTVGQQIGSVVFMYIGIFLTALSLKFFVALFRGRGTFRECLLISLTMGVYAILSELVSLPSTSNPLVVETLARTGDIAPVIADPKIFMWVLLSALLFLFLWYQLTRLSRHLFHVGWIRASLIACTAGISEGFLERFFLADIWLKLFHQGYA